MNRTFRFLDVTLPTPAENLALDEALVEQAERVDSSGESNSWFRIWESDRPFIVLGRASRLADEVNRHACESAQIPIYRRCSGGTSVVAGPGCLMYALIASFQQFPDLRMVDAAHAWVMEHLRAALATLQPDIQFQGTCDLTLDNRKFSGNSVRSKRDHLLYHGTILYDFPLHELEAWLKRPPREPEYRQQRTHRDFLTNFPHPRSAIWNALLNHWPLIHGDWTWPRTETALLAASKYSDPAWNLRGERSA